MKLLLYTFMWQIFSIAQDEKYKAVLARKMLMKNIVLKEFYQKAKKSYVNHISVKQAHPRTRI